MRNPFKYSTVGLAAVLAFWSVAAVAQSSPSANQNRNGGAPQNPAAKPRDDSTGGPAPVHDLSGTWKGPNEASLNNRIPPMTAAGQAKLKLNIPDPFSATSNDPWKNV